MSDTPNTDAPWLPPDVWDAVADPSVPPGVMVVVDSDGTRYPMPLVEFMEDSDGE